MKEDEFKNILSSCILKLEKILEQDLTTLDVDQEWSAINDAAQHLIFLKDQLQGLSDAVHTKN